MQYSEETNISGNRRSSIGFIRFTLLLLCLLSIIIGATIIKISSNHNTYSDNGISLSGKTDIKRILTDSANSVGATDNVYVKIGGRPIGISVNAGGLIVLGQTEVATENGAVNPALNSGLKTGDIVLSINDEKLTSIFQLKKVLEKADGAVKLKASRGGKVFESEITPALDKLTSQKRLGLLLKEDMGGVGTLTFVTNDGKFGALGHYIADAESGLSYELNSGNIYETSVDGVIKGERGKAGGLIADVNRLSEPIGDINQNTKIGIFGNFTADYDGALYKIADKGEAKIGPAKVFTTIEGTQPKFYDIDIVKVVSQDEPEEKGMVIAVRDKELLEKTGGIVQGMSGSPIIQNGVLIGAVTHVFIQDPTRGYAVHSRFMYEYATENSEATAFCDVA